MKQTCLMSLVEPLANVTVGYCVAVITQILIFPMFGLHTTQAQNLKMGAVFTVVSIARSFALRRLFERRLFHLPPISEYEVSEGKTSTSQEQADNRHRNAFIAHPGSNQGKATDTYPRKEKCDYNVREPITNPLACLFL